MKNYVWLINCKTGNKSFKSYLNSIFKQVKFTQYHCIWRNKNVQIIGLYYPDPSTAEILSKIEDPTFFMIVRNPISRIISSYNFSKSKKRTAESFEKFLQNIIQIQDKYNIQQGSFSHTGVYKTMTLTERFLIEHTRPLFECAKQLISIKNVTYFLHTENLSSDANTFIRQILQNDKFHKTVTHLNRSTHFKKDSSNISQKEKELINKIIGDDLELYNIISNNTTCS